MPKVTISDGKGLVQAKGSGLTCESDSVLKGNVDLTSATSFTFKNTPDTIAQSELGGANYLELSGSQSGKHFLLGDNGRGSNYSVFIPTDTVGWIGRFSLTGSLTASSAAVLTGSFTATSSPWTGGVSSTVPAAGAAAQGLSLIHI